MRKQERIFGRQVVYRWSPDCDVNSFRPTNPDKPTRSDIRRNRLLMDMLLSAGDVTTARKIVAAYPYLRDYDEKIRQCVAEMRQQETSERLGEAVMV
jgi:hypothetical protein